MMNTDQPPETTEPIAPSASASELALGRARKIGPSAMAFVIGLAAFTAQASETDLVRDIQRYCTVCWRNAHLDPTLWEDCTQEVCCRLLAKARVGELELSQVMADDTPERRELVRAIDMVRKRVQRAKRHLPLDPIVAPSVDADRKNRERFELGEILETARGAVLSARQDRILELWMRGWTVPEIGEELKMGLARVSDEKYKALRKLEQYLRDRCEELGLTATPSFAAFG